jgi:hypothetical protein
MKFHGATMVGPFVNQKLSALPVFDPSRDQGRMVWLSDGTLWYGSDVDWTDFSSGSGDASEVEDLYSDLLRTTIFMNASYDGFKNEDLVLSTDMTYNSKDKYYEFTNGQTITSTNLFDLSLSIPYVDYVMVYVNFIGASTPLIEVTSNGTDWNTVQNHRMFKIPDATIGTDLRIKFTGSGNGTLLSWGVLYNKDLTASCSKYGLTYNKFEATDGQTSFEANYNPGSIQVFLNGDLIDDLDFEATNGTDVVFYRPLQSGDIVYILRFSTSILGSSGGVDTSNFVSADGTTPFTGNQSMGGNRLTSVADGIDESDAVTMGQLSNAIMSGMDTSNFVRHDGTVPFTGNQSMQHHRLTELQDGIDLYDAVNVQQLGEYITRSELSDILEEYGIVKIEGFTFVNGTYGDSTSPPNNNTVQTFTVPADAQEDSIIKVHLWGGDNGGYTYGEFVVKTVGSTFITTEASHVFPGQKLCVHVGYLGGRAAIWRFDTSNFNTYQNELLVAGGGGSEAKVIGGYGGGTIGGNGLNNTKLYTTVGTVTANGGAGGTQSTGGAGGTASNGGGAGITGVQVWGGAGGFSGGTSGTGGYGYGGKGGDGRWGGGGGGAKVYSPDDNPTSPGFAAGGGGAGSGYIRPGVLNAVTESYVGPAPPHTNLLAYGLNAGYDDNPGRVAFEISF